MVNSEKREPVNDREVDDMDCEDRSNDYALDDASSVETTAVGTRSISGGSRNQIGIVERLTDVFVDEGDGDLLLQQNDREDRVLRWLQALDMQVMGACRADERLKPLLKLNVSSGTAEDLLLVHLSQHFEPSEVGKLARFLCIPLVSVRVGKINKQGTLLCPTATRGNLNLTLLPTSDLRISFIGDNGHIERLATLSSDYQCSDVSIEEISEDKSGRSFCIRNQGGEIFYFWCSEKSKVHGEELLGEMMDLLRRKPSLTELTGISVSRLDCFTICLPAYLVGTSGSNTQASSFLSVVSSADTSLESLELCPSAQSSSSSSSSSSSFRTSCLQHCSSQGLQSSLLYHGSQSPESSSFEEGLPNSLSLKNVSMERFWQRGDAPVTGANNPSVSSHSTPEQSCSNGIDDEKFLEGTETCLFPPFSFLESLVKSAEPPFISPISQVPTISSTLLSPYYCWCPPIASTLQYKIAPPELPISSESLPPFSSFMSNSPPINLAEISSVDFPVFLPEPLVRLPLSMPTSQPIPTFTPLMCEPIVHIPVIDVCSSGEGYFGSAGPTISTAIPPLHPKFVNPLITETKSVEEGARETLRLLVSRSSSNTGHSLMDVLPPLLTNSDAKQNIVAAGSRGLYCGYRDVGAISDTIASSGLVSLSKRLRTGMVAQRSAKEGNLVGESEKLCDSGGSSKEKLCDSGESSANDGGSSLSSLMEDGTDQRM